MKKFQHHFNKVFPRRFGNYWKKNKSILNIDSDLKKITDDFIQSKSYKFVSNYWHRLNIENYKTLGSVGEKEAISRINRCFHTFVDLHDEWIEGAIQNLSEDKNASVNSDLFKKQKGFTHRQSIFYNYLCFLLYNNLKKLKYFKNLSDLQNKTYLGYDDPFVEIDNLKLTSDKINSLFDCEKMNKAFELNNSSSVLEIGAGSGRTSEALLTIYNDLKYVICDIPVSLFISYKRLKAAFPKKRISLLTNVQTKEELQKAIKSNDISFIFPHQLEDLSKKFFNLVVAIDCLHEMDKKTIKFYFDSVNELTENFYFSIWSKTVLPYSKNFFNSGERLDFDKGDYDIPKNWKSILKENLIFPSNFLGLGYKIK